MTAAAERTRSTVPIDWGAIRAIVAKDLTAVKRSRLIMVPMIVVPMLLMVIVPLVLGLFARNTGEIDLEKSLQAVRVPSQVAEEFTNLPPDEQMLALVLGFLLAPLFLIVPLMVSAVLAADAFAGERERRTLEGLMHLPIDDRDLFLAKVLGAYIPAVLVSWIGFAAYLVVANTVAWPAMERIFLPTKEWMIMIFWVGPAVAMFGLGVMVRVSARAKTTQEATQLGGAVILPLIFLAAGQSSGLLLVTVPLALTIGAVCWAIALTLTWRGAQRFTRDRLATQV